MQKHSRHDRRSRSPGEQDHERTAKRRRSRSPRSRHSYRDSERDRKQLSLPFNQRHLHKHHLDTYRSLFGEYLDIQKQLYIDDLSSDEVRGRWKSFLGKWNRGELSEGWYDPDTKRRADERQTEPMKEDRPAPTSRATAPDPAHLIVSNEEDEDDDELGPSLPSNAASYRAGPAIPSLQDLQHRRELSEQDREARVDDIRYERKVDRKLQKERLEELVPRAEPGSRERQLEKKREVATNNRAFADSKDPDAVDVAESDLMGDEGLEGFKAKRQAKERQKNEREIRKEEMLRAREAEREEKLAEHRKKEEKTMDMLRALAQQRYGGNA